MRKFLLLFSVILCSCSVANANIAAIVINEFVVDHIGTDTNEFIELFGTPNFDFSNLTLIEVEGDGSSAGLIDDLIFPVGTTDANGFWWTGFDPGGANDIENGSVTLLLVEGFTGMVGDDIDTDNDGVIDAVFWSSIIDGIGTSDGDAGDFVYALDLPPGFDGDSFQPGGASRIPDGMNTGSTSDWVRNDFGGFGLPGFSDTYSPGNAINTPGASNMVPEPSCLTLLGMAALALVTRRR